MAAALAHAVEVAGRDTVVVASVVGERGGDEVCLGDAVGFVEVERAAVAEAAVDSERDGVEECVEVGAGEREAMFVVWEGERGS